MDNKPIQKKTKPRCFFDYKFGPILKIKMEGEVSDTYGKTRIGIPRGASVPSRKSSGE